MSAPSQSERTLYGEDLVLWATQTAQLLRDGAELNQEEREQIAEEIHSMGLNDRRQMESRTIKLVVHLLKVKFHPEKQTRSWDLTIVNRRREIETSIERLAKPPYGSRA